VSGLIEFGMNRSAVRSFQASETVGNTWQSSDGKPRLADSSATTSQAAIRSLIRGCLGPV